VKLVRDENLAAVRVAAEMNLPALLKKFQPGSSSFSKPVRKGD